MESEIDLSSIDLNLLVLFEAVMLERHVGRAGVRLHLSASAVSHGLVRLRQLLHDPLFLKHPKGVVPTERAQALAGPIAELLVGVRTVIGAARGFDPLQSTRRFTLGAPDAVLAVVVPPLLAALATEGPTIDLTLRTTLPQAALTELDGRHADLVLQPLVDPPARFTATLLYDEHFVIAMRRGHVLQKRMTLARYCAASHVVVSTTGEPLGNVDVELSKLGRSRRVATTVPNFLLGLALVAETDLLAAVPRRAAALADNFGVVLVEPPAPLAPLTPLPIHLIATHAAMADAGVAWLHRLVIDCVPPGTRRRRDARGSAHS